MSNTSTFALQLMVLTTLVFGFGSWMLQQVTTRAPKRVVVLTKDAENAARRR